jgi:hypothetical protein
MNIQERPRLSIPRISESLVLDSEEAGANLRKHGASACIDKINWQDFPRRPAATVYAGYTALHLWLFYTVAGDFFRARALADQEAVWEDSCVEFFISKDEPRKDLQPVESVAYQNFEFNAVGTAFSATGTMAGRMQLPLDQMRKIVRIPGLNRNNLPLEGSAIDWELTVAIPLDLLDLQPGSSFSANFYKCGDLTKMEHYLSWSPIVSGKPNFHLPQYFGKVKLML